MTPERRTKAHRIGVIADTHGLVRAEVLRELAGCEQIWHAGDVGKVEVLEELKKIAPVTAVRGNVDRGEWVEGLPVSAVMQVEDQLFYMIHRLEDLDLNPAAAGFRAVISGHSHRYKEEWKEGVVYLNPGSAGPRRFGGEVSLVVLMVEGERLEVEYVKVG
jgi:putative phosphoesterase